MQGEGGGRGVLPVPWLCAEWPDVRKRTVGLVLPLKPPAEAPASPRTAAIGGQLPDYAQINRENWNWDAPNWVAAGRRHWRGVPEWSIWLIPNEELPLLPADMHGLDAIELGCGTGYVSCWMHRRGARVVAIAPSERQLDTAQMLATEYNADIEWIHNIAETVPKPDASFDFAISEYGAAIWEDPYAWIPEAHRLLRAGGELVFLGHSSLSQICLPAVADGCTEDHLHRPYFAMHRIEWSDIEEEGGIEFNLTIGDWFRLFDDSGFDVIDFREVHVPASASGDRFAVTVEWARRFTSEQTWRLRKRD